MANRTRIASHQALSVMLATAMLFGAPTSQAQDSLYIGDIGDNTVKSFGAVDTATGTYQGAFVKNSLSGLQGPMGLIFPTAGQLVVSDQNLSTSTRGDILQFDAKGLVRKIVNNGSPDAPAVPRAIVKLPDGSLLVAEFTQESRQTKALTPGRLLKYTSDGVLTRVFDPPPSGTLKPCDAAGTAAEFHPRGVIVGPDIKVYVSNYPCLSQKIGGEVLRYGVDGSFQDVFIDRQPDLNRPEGLVFGPDGYLYVTSFKVSGGNDKILIFQGPNSTTPANFVTQINLDDPDPPPGPPGSPPVTPSQRAYAQAILFGPGGKLFVPISGDGPDTGSVRRYDVNAKSYDVFVPPAKAGGPLQVPFYLTFGITHPGTLMYGDTIPGGGPDQLICLCRDGTTLHICQTLDCYSGSQQDALCGPACAFHGGEAGSGCYFNQASCVGQLATMTVLPLRPPRKVDLRALGFHF